MRRWYGGAEGVLAFTRLVMRCGECAVLYIIHNDECISQSWILEYTGH
jgi:hypothetical protein